MTRRRGRTVGGGRLHDAVPAGRWRTLTLLGAVSVSGWVATMTIEAPTDGDVFLAYLEQVLCPQLRLCLSQIPSAAGCGLLVRIESGTRAVLETRPQNQTFLVELFRKRFWRSRLAALGASASDARN